VQPVQTIVHLEEDIEQEQLRHSVDDVDELDDHIARDEVIAVEFTADQAADFGYEVLDADDAAGPVFALCQHVSVHLIHYVPQRLYTHAPYATIFFLNFVIVRFILLLHQLAAY